MRVRVRVGSWVRVRRTSAMRVLPAYTSLPGPSVTSSTAISCTSRWSRIPCASASKPGSDASEVDPGLSLGGSSIQPSARFSRSHPRLFSSSLPGTGGALSDACGDERRASAAVSAPAPLASGAEVMPTATNPCCSHLGEG